MNIFRLAGDLSHSLAFIILLWKIWKTRSCAGISRRSQILFALTFTTRYWDLIFYTMGGRLSELSIYNSVMKIFFIGASYATLYLMYVKFKATYDRNPDTFRIEFLVIPAVILALVSTLNYDTYHCLFPFYDFSLLEIDWTFSVYLESVAILPQLFLVYKTGEAKTIIFRYLLCLGSYRALYILNWGYRYYSEGFYNLISIIAGVVQIVLYCGFFYLYITKAKTDRLISQALSTGNISLAVEICINDGRWADALVLAQSGGLQLLQKTQKLYFKSVYSDSTKLISAVVTSDWVSFMKNCDASCRKEIPAAILTYSQAWPKMHKKQDDWSLQFSYGSVPQNISSSFTSSNVAPTVPFQPTNPLMAPPISFALTPAPTPPAQDPPPPYDTQMVKSSQSTPPASSMPAVPTPLPSCYSDVKPGWNDPPPLKQSTVKPHSISNEPAVSITSQFPDMLAPVQPTPPLSQPVMPGGYCNPSAQTEEHPPPPPGIVGSIPYLPSQTPEEPKIERGLYELY